LIEKLKTHTKPNTTTITTKKISFINLTKKKIMLKKKRTQLQTNKNQ